MIALLALATVMLDPLRAQDARLATLTWRLETANAAFCPGQYVSGLAVHARSQYPRAQQAALGLGDRPAIAAVALGSAADRAGVNSGDILLSVDGHATPNVSADAGYTPVGQTEAMLETPATARTLSIRQGIIEKTVTLTLDPGCASWVQVIPGRAINAQADGRYVQINAAMLDFTRNDDELATIAAHELAHNILRHRALRTPSKQAEYAADRLGVWLMARARYNVDAVIPFWTRFEARTNAGIFADGTHPSSKKRLAALTAAVAALKAQAAAGAPLIPPSQDRIPR